MHTQKQHKTGICPYITISTASTIPIQETIVVIFDDSYGNSGLKSVKYLFKTLTDYFRLSPMQMEG
jgi:hypothetical protein